MYAIHRIKWKPLLLNLFISLGVGAVSGLLTQTAMRRYGDLRRPPLSPPAAVFPVVWTLLFLLMGVSAYLIGQSNCAEKKEALTVYGVQLLVNFFWPIIFFNAHAYSFALIWLIVLWLLVLAMILLFLQCRRAAAILQIPYLVWLTFAAYLNYCVWILN